MAFPRISVIIVILIGYSINAAIAADGRSSIDNVVVKSAANATSNHAPIGATGEFSHKVSNIFITFESRRPTGYQTHYLTFDLYSEEAGRVISSGGWVRLSYGVRYSIKLERS